MHVLKNTPAFRNAIGAWYDRSRRPLPWRTEQSLYRTVVSELMAQQTQIATMLPYFERWMQRFPDFEALAGAAPAEVLKHWEGLGYYSRARNLHKLAKIYVSLEEKPRCRAEWAQLPGIGPYTSAAISSIVFNQAEAVVDGNVVRVIARLTDDATLHPNNAAAVKASTPAAEALLDPQRPGRHNEAMMELGATVCLKRKPLCTVCPVIDLCAARRAGTQDVRPRVARRATEQLTVDRAWALQKGRLLLRRRADDAGQLAGQYELPELEGLPHEKRRPEPVLEKSRAITHRRIRERIYAVRISGVLPDDFEWLSPAQLRRCTLSGPHRRWVESLLPQARAAVAKGKP
jgi:A/G-specific adenine glycosylase